MIFLGAPGAGKGTLASTIGKELGLPQVSTGDLFRDAVKNGTELGLRVKSIMERGSGSGRADRRPVQERLGRADWQRLHPDGFPRTIPQAEACPFQRIDGVVNFNAGTRWWCAACPDAGSAALGASITWKTCPRRRASATAAVGSCTFRDDDRSTRSEPPAYQAQTEPLIGYRSRGCCMTSTRSRTEKSWPSCARC
jgi:adenylate kinase